MQPVPDGLANGWRAPDRSHRRQPDRL